MRALTGKRSVPQGGDKKRPCFRREGEQTEEQQYASDIPLVLQVHMTEEFQHSHPVFRVYLVQVSVVRAPMTRRCFSNLNLTGRRFLFLVAA